MAQIDFKTIVRYAWVAYDSSRAISRITDISAKVSTNHVYKITLRDKTIVIAKLSYFGNYEHFCEDHIIINTVSNNLPYPFDNLLSRALIKKDKVYVHRFQDDLIDAWVIFYRPVKIKTRLPRRLNEEQIGKLGTQFALLHRSCDIIRNTLPKSSKTMSDDIRDLLITLDDEEKGFEFLAHRKMIQEQCHLFLDYIKTVDRKIIRRIPVFVDWNIGNFSVLPSLKLYSRWDYDWFRMSSRMIDFYFLSRVVSDVGDKTAFTYNIETLSEERFIIFLKAYHKHFPLTREEIVHLPEMYRFFLLNYVVKYGSYFFHSIYANKLQKDVYQTHLNSIESFNIEPLLEALEL